MQGKDILVDRDNVAVNGLLDATPYQDVVHRSWSYADIGFGHDLVVWKSVVEGADGRAVRLRYQHRA
jgi:hypothetical protein